MCTLQSGLCIAAINISKIAGTRGGNVKIKLQTQGTIETLLKHRCPQGALNITETQMSTGCTKHYWNTDVHRVH